MWLVDEEFFKVVGSVPLVSIDFVIVNEDERVLLGRRNNRPARGFWFVPGGRVQKNETLDAAFLRLFQNELGVERHRADAEFLGVYEHFYKDSVFGEGGTFPETHYVVLAYKVSMMTSDFPSLPEDQHGGFVWWEPRDFSDDGVHAYSKAYLRAVNKD